MELWQVYRPKRLAQLIGQDKAIAEIRNVLGSRRFDRGKFLFCGQSGIGKSAAAECVAHELGASITHIDGEGCSVDVVRALQDDLQPLPLGFQDGWRVIVVDEAHRMTGKAVGAWLTLLERLPAKRVVIFTTTSCPDDGLFEKTAPEELKAFIGRVDLIKLTNQGLARTFAPFLYHVARRENLDGHPISAYETLMKQCGNSPRKALSEIQLGRMKVSH